MLKRTLSAILLALYIAVVAFAQEPPAPPKPSPTPQASPTQPPPPRPTPMDPVAEAESRKKADEAKKKAEEAKKKYEALLDKAKKREGAIDFKALRYTYFETPEFRPLTGMQDYRTVWLPLSQGKYAEALTAAEAVLAKNYVDINAHMVAYIGFHQTGNAEKANHHKLWADGLIESIKSTGDGKSVETAFEVISVSEEYAFFQSLGVRAVKQSLLQEKGHTFDAVIVVDPKTNQQATYYFNVDKPFSAYARE